MPGRGDRTPSPSPERRPCTRAGAGRSTGNNSRRSASDISHDLIVFNHDSADVVAAPFQVCLGLVASAAPDPRVNRQAVLQPEGIHQARDTFSTRDTQQIVLR